MKELKPANENYYYDKFNDRWNNIDWQEVKSSLSESYSGIPLGEVFKELYRTHKYQGAPTVGHFMEAALKIQMRSSHGHGQHDTWQIEDWECINRNEEVLFAGTGMECKEYRFKNGPKGIYYRRPNQESAIYSHKQREGINRGLRVMYGRASVEYMERTYGTDLGDPDKARFNADSFYTAWMDREIQMQSEPICQVPEDDR